MAQPNGQHSRLGPIALVGGDEFRGPAAAFDRLLISIAAQDRPAVAILPTAAADSNPYLAANHGVRHFERLNAEPYPVMIRDSATANDEALIEELRRADIVYFSGGDPLHLLNTMRGSLAWTCIEELSQRGAIVAGSSAGAMVLGEMMRRPRLGGWVDALGVYPGLAVLPHHESSDPAQTSSQLVSQTSGGLTVLGIDARTGCLGRPGSWRVVGSGRVTVYQGAGWQVYDSGAHLPGDV